jgi:hypothetical protein
MFVFEYCIGKYQISHITRKCYNFYRGRGLNWYASKMISQPTLCAIPIVRLDSSYSFVDKWQVMPSWKHIPCRGCQTPASDCGKNWWVWPSITTFTSPSLRPKVPLEPCPNFASSPLSLIVSTRFFQWIFVTPIVVFCVFSISTLFWQPLHLHLYCFEQLVNEAQRLFNNLLVGLLLFKSLF